jgi:regulator of sigma E protease
MYWQTLLTLGKFFLGISIIVGIHEMGHMLLAKFFGMRVERYMIGFPPKIVSITYGETEYAIGTIPLGGYVKIAGMVDESLDNDQLEEAPKPYEFRSNPAWQRATVMAGGILANLVSAIIMATCLLLSMGKAYLPKEVVNEHGIAPTTLGSNVGLQRGDKILQINHQDYTSFSQVHDILYKTEKAVSYTVLRNDQSTAKCWQSAGQPVPPVNRYLHHHAGDSSQSRLFVRHLKP